MDGLFINGVFEWNGGQYTFHGVIVGQKGEGGGVVWDAFGVADLINIKLDTELGHFTFTKVYRSKADKGDVEYTLVWVDQVGTWTGYYKREEMDGGKPAFAALTPYPSAMPYIRTLEGL